MQFNTMIKTAGIAPIFYGIRSERDSTVVIGTVSVRGLSRFTARA